jgi:hypothetical protein
MEDNRQGQTPRQTESDQESGAQIVLRYNNNYNKKANNVRYWALLCTKEPFLQRKHSEQLLGSGRVVVKI